MMMTAVKPRDLHKRLASIRKQERIEQKEQSRDTIPVGMREFRRIHKRDASRTSQKKKDKTETERQVLTLEQTVAGTIVKIFDTECYKITSTADSVSEGITQRFREEYSIPFELLLESTMRELEKHELGFDDIAPSDIILVDIETTGLLSSPLFLIGILIMEDELVVYQYFARNYAEEAAVIRGFLDICRGRKLLVSFNGRTFDLPYIRSRSAATGVAFDVDPVHLDLLHVGRRMWRDELPDCRLQTIERHICGIMRSGDIPGHLIPEEYHAYVQSGNASMMARVIEHNLHDLITLAEIMIRLR